MRVVDFQPQHLTEIKVQGAQTFELYDPVSGPSLQKAGPCFTVLDGETVIACMGLIDVWPNGTHTRYIVWALISECGPVNFLKITRRARNWLAAQSGPVRVEATVAANFKQGHRWVDLLGFKCETPDGMEGYSPYGDRFFLYSWVKA
jgi:hypothetical protein